MGSLTNVVLLASGGLLLLLDQWSKEKVQACVVDRSICWGGVVHIRHVRGLKPPYQRAGVRALLVLVWLLAAGSVIWLHSSGRWFQSRTAMVGLGCALGGAVGNLTDIIRRRYVVDFIDLGWWPVFNLADLGIVGGVLLAFWRWN
jgi:signal peptidase II